MHSELYRSKIHSFSTVGRSRGGTGGRDLPPLKNYKNIGFLSNTGPDYLENHKATKSALHDGPSFARQRNVI